MKRLTKSSTNRMLDGVIGGVAEYVQIDPVLARIIFLVFAVFTAMGPAIILYIVAMVVMPREYNGSTRSFQEQQNSVEHTFRPERKSYSHTSPRNSGLLFGGFFIVLGTIFLLNNLFDYNLFFFFRQFGHYLWPLILVAIGVLLLFRGRK